MDDPAAHMPGLIANKKERQLVTALSTDPKGMVGKDLVRLLQDTYVFCLEHFAGTEPHALPAEVLKSYTQFEKKIQAWPTGRKGPRAHILAYKAICKDIDEAIRVLDRMADAAHQLANQTNVEDGSPSAPGSWYQEMRNRAAESEWKSIAAECGSVQILPPAMFAVYGNLNEEINGYLGGMAIGNETDDVASVLRQMKSKVLGEKTVRPDGSIEFCIAVPSHKLPGASSATHISGFQSVADLVSWLEQNEAQDGDSVSIVRLVWNVPDSRGDPAGRNKAIAEDNRREAVESPDDNGETKHMIESMENTSSDGGVSGDHKSHTNGDETSGDEHGMTSNEKSDLRME
ncbi:hypothetical protein K470DRAFT_270764 [Piedraia hortae CBS 480.64]|uniref:Uncharacterized protein n=1 Tax=Piedraia hortae CBS 480.64 TaxID=1314780 RepID=A0A6A7BZ96_9PEZI|nr:hypothetical protein K470DRAFT_276968 [Piedraia hortae CBS 480.64]KAF2860390.1 hypothetical protein K470DRAFT_270764 [Piedraia hortae CBS 480.64]